MEGLKRRQWYSSEQSESTLFLWAHAETDEEREEFERIWRVAELLPGRTEPCLDARESARKVAEYYHFPGWS